MAQLIVRFQETADFILSEDREITINVAAYVLRVNGAKAGNGGLREPRVVISSITR